ncbi:hypothetical protein [Streptomyces sp. 7N604]|uniref:hypothetical protein n=1 Tax=Streptomyces sp. 7N604 TaxID=3457415 RepID=UPI003FD26554
MTDYLWRSYWYNATEGMESRYWEDSQFTEIMYVTCSSSSNTSTDVELWKEINNWPDESRGDRRFTACFNGYMSHSDGEWHDLPSDKYYFEISDIAGSSWLDVDDVLVDNTLAD